MIIKGDTHEFISKWRVYPIEREVIRKTKFGEYIGEKEIQVDKVINIKPIPESAIEKIEKDMALDEFVKDLIFKLGTQNIDYWKKSLKVAFKTKDPKTAIFLAKCLTWYLGGAWIIVSEEDTLPTYYVWSKGYYHYIGA